MTANSLRGIFETGFHIPGQLSANLDIRFKVPCDCQLLQVSACQSDADAAGITVGDGSDTDEHLTTQSVGVSGTPSVFDGDDFVDSDGNSHTRYYPALSAGDTVNIAVDYDYNAGDGGGAASDVTIVLTFAGS
jgi:hypothetical protein